MKMSDYETTLIQGDEILIAKDPAAVFDNAINDNKLSTDPKSANYAGDYMYMHSTTGEGDFYRNITDYFKNRNTRKYDVKAYSLISRPWPVD